MQTFIEFLTTIGGVGVVVFGLSSWLGKIWAERIGEELKASNTKELEHVKANLVQDLESYKVQLKKSEFLFQKEFEAASAFSALIQSVHPGFNHPMMDWYEACDEIAQNFGKIEIRLGDFLAKFGAVLTDAERKILTGAISDAGYGKFDVIEGQDNPDANTNAGELYNNLLLLEKQMIGRVRGQSSL